MYKTLIFFVEIIASAHAFSTKHEWSDIAIKTAKKLSISQRSKLHDSGIVDIKRPISITAKHILSAEDCLLDNDDDSISDDTTYCTKIVHFQRHGQGYHNLIADIFRECGNEIDFNDPNPTTNPFVRMELLDAPLTELGREQSVKRQMEASILSPQVIIVSPLQRAIQTALISFQAHLKDEYYIPLIAHEGCREQLGLHACNKRRRLSELTTDYPKIDFRHVVSGDEDELWHPTDRETPLQESERIYRFLTEFIMKRPEQEIAVVGHSGWLFTMLNAVLDCGDDDELSSWFLTSEIRSLRLSFVKNSFYKQS